MSDEFDIAVIGDGIAGMSAALTSARLGRSTVLLSSGVPGGQLLSIEHIDGVPGFPEGVAGYDLCPMTQAMCDAAGVELRVDRCDGLAPEGADWVLETAGGQIRARGVIVATGSALATIGVPGEAAFQGRGVSACASCDGPLLRGKTAVVVGGGDSAMQEALALVEHVEKVVLVDRGAALKGQSAYRERIEASAKVELRFGAQVMAIMGDASGVTHVRIKDLASGAQSELATAAVFIFTGLVPNSAFLAGQVPLDDAGHVRVDAALRSAAAGLCAAGNVREGAAHRAAGGMGDGATAAAALDAYLTTGQWRTDG